MSTVYPYDPDASLPTNLVKGVLKHSTFPNKYNVLVPLEAPFFRKDLRLKKGELDLIEGLDYYLVYYYKKAADGIKKPVYGGILPISNFDNVEYQLRTLGGAHMVPYTELGRYLNNPDMTDPRSTDWSDLQRYPVSVDPIDPPANFEEAYEQDIIIRSIVKIKEAVLASGPERETAFSEIFDELKATENFYNVNFLEIHDKSEHKHLYTAEMVGALRKEATAVDALKAYGYTLAKMVDHAKEHGVSMVRVEELVDSNIGLLHGSLINTVDAGVIVTTHGGSAPRPSNIKLAKDKVTVDTGSGTVGFSGAEGGWFGAGVNSIIVPKVGGSLERPILNGYYMLVAKDVKRYLFSPSAATLRVTTENTETVSLLGDGTTSNPIGGQIRLPIATTTKEGLAFLVDEWGGDVSNAVITQDLITKTLDSLENGNYASKTLTVNGKAFGNGQVVTLNKADVGLSDVDDTSSAQKPVTNALVTALANKSPALHGHEITDITNVDLASATKAGLGKVGTGGFALAQEVEDFVEGNKETIDIIGNSLPGWASSGAYYGDSSYLPVPVQGNYGHVGYNSWAIHGEWENDNKFVLIDTGKDTFGSGCYYTTIEFNIDGSLKAISPTVVEYQPSFLGGSPVIEIFPGGGDGGAFCLVDKNTNKWLVVTNGTMEASRHIGYRIDATLSSEENIVKIGNVIYFLRYAGTAWQPFFHLRKLDLKTASVNGVNSLTNVILSGKDIFNNSIQKHEIHFAPLDVSTSPTAQARVIREDDGYWTGVNFSHAAKNSNVAVKDGKMRLFGFHSPYCSNSFGNTTNGRLTTSIIIDPLLETFLIEDPDSMKVKLTRSGFTTADNKNTNTWNGLPPNNTTCRFVGKKMVISCYAYNLTKRTAAYRKSVSLHHWDLCGRELAEPIKAIFDGVHLLGASITEMKSVYRDIGFLKPNSIFTRDGDGKAFLVDVNPNTTYPGFTGLGPTSRRVHYPDIKALRVPRNCANGVIKGFNGSPGATLPTVVNADGVSGNQMTFAQDAKLVLRLRELAATDVANLGTVDTEKTQLVVYGDVNQPDAVFIVHVTMVLLPAGQKTLHPRVYAVSNVSVSGTNLMVPESATIDLIEKFTTGNTYLGLNDVNDYGGQSFYHTVSDGTVYHIGQGLYHSYVGNSAHHMVDIGKTNTGVYKCRMRAQAAAYRDHYKTHHPKLGLMSARMTGTLDAWMGFPLENTVDGFVNSVEVGGQHILFAIRPEESWNVYFTQPYPLFLNGASYIVPVTELDLRVLYPTNHKNRTFYIHVRVVDGKGLYTIDTTRLKDSDNHLYIGFIKTDDKKIIELAVHNVARYGSVVSLEKHMATTLAHTAAGSSTLNESPYGELKNYTTIDTFKIPTFKEVYDKWHRFSHVYNNVNQPAVPGELTSWRYQESNDAVISTTNSSSYIGFISDDFVGDYVFNTVVYSPDGDNDLITILLAAFKKGDIDDKEHTLSLCLDQTPVAETHTRVPSNLCVMDNLAQSTEKVITDFATGRVSRSWNKTYAHVHVRRTGNILKIAVAHRDKPTLAQSSPAESRKFYDSLKQLTEEQIYASDLYLKREINLTIEAPKYARSCRYGYGALSQPSATFESVLRPGAQLSGFYASEETLRLANKDNVGEHRIVNGKVALPSRPSNVGSDDVMTNMVVRGDNYGDRFWPTGLATPAWNSFASGVSPTNYTERDSAQNPGKNRWMYTKCRFSISKTTTVKIRMLADDEGHYFLYRGAEEIFRTGKLNGINTREVTVSAGEYCFTCLIAEQPSAFSPTAAYYEISLDGVLTYTATTSGTKVVTLCGGVSDQVPVVGEAVPHGVMFTYERPLGTTIAVSANIRNNRIRQQIDSGTGFGLTPMVDTDEAAFCAVAVDTVEAGGVLKDKIYIHTPLVTDSTSEVNYQLRITKI